MWAVLKVLIEFVTIMFLFYILMCFFLATRHVETLTGDRAHTPCFGRQSLNRWTTREVPRLS